MKSFFQQVRNYGRLSGKLALITGGANGIGLATTERFLDEGCRVVIWDKSESSINGCIESLSSKFSDEHIFHDIVDVTDENDVSESVKYVEEEIGGIDILVNNAGISNDDMSYKLTSEMFDSVIDVNLKGVFLVGRECMKGMMEREYGSIVNVSSVCANGTFGLTAYTASKSGVIGMTKTWAKELGRKGIRVNAIAPGYTKTELISSASEEFIEKLSSTSVLGRLAEPIEIANGILFLASDEASYVTGHVLSVDGFQVL